MLIYSPACLNKSSRAIEFILYFTVFPRSSDQFCIVNYSIKWVTTTWTDGRMINNVFFLLHKSAFNSINLKKIMGVTVFFLLQSFAYNFM